MIDGRSDFYERMPRILDKIVFYILTPTCERMARGLYMQGREASRRSLAS